MTKEELEQHYKDVVLPMIKETVSVEVAERVEASISKSVGDEPEVVKHAKQRASSILSLDEVSKKYDKGIPFGKAVRAMAAAKNAGEGTEYALAVMRKWGDEELAETLRDTREKAMAAGDPNSGGFLVPDQFSNDVIELLRPASAVRRLNPMILPMPTGTVRIPKITSGSSGSYIGENTNATKSEVGTGQLTLTWKKLAALVPVSNDLLRYSSPGADGIVRNDVVRALAERENRAFLRDNGTNSTPKGLRHWVNAANIMAANGTVTLANVTTDLGQLILKLEDNNIPMTRPAWIMAPRTKQYLATVQTTTGAFVYRDEILQGRLWGWPVAITTEVPTNLTDGGGTNESEIYLIDMDDAVIGEAQRLVVDASTEAAYMDGNTLVSSFSQDQTVIRAIAEHDFAMRRDLSVAVMNEVTWGA